MSAWWRVGVLALCFLALVVNATAGSMVWVVVMAVCIAVNGFFLGAIYGERVFGGSR